MGLNAPGMSPGGSSVLAFTTGRPTPRPAAAGLPDPPGGLLAGLRKREGHSHTRGPHVPGSHSPGRQWNHMNKDSRGVVLRDPTCLTANPSTHSRTPRPTDTKYS